MNKQESDILNVILQYHCRNQRALAERCGFSLGMVNRSVKALQGQGFLTTDMELTEKARLEMAKHRPKNAVILAAGYGMRMVPIAYSARTAHPFQRNGAPFRFKLSKAQQVD